MTETDTSREVVEKIGSDLAQFGCLGERARDTLRALLARAEKAETERDTAWNDAIEAAATYHDKFLMTKTSVDVEAVVSSTEAIRALRKGGPA